MIDAIDADVSQSEDDFNVAQGALLRDARTRRGLTLRGVETATQGEFKMASLSAYERGDRGVPMLRLLKLASLYDMQLEELVPKQPMYRTASTVERESAPGRQAPPDPSARADYLQAVIDIHGEAVIATSLDGTIVAWNYHAERLFGCAAADVLGHRTTVLHAAEGDDRALLRDVATGIERAESMVLRARPQRIADGSLVLVDVHIDPLRNATGSLIGWAAVARAPGAIEPDGQGLRQAEDILDWMEDIARIGTWNNSVGPEALVQLSPEAYRLLGIEPGQAVRNIDFFDLVHPDDRQLLVETFISARNERKRKQLEVRVGRSDAPTRWLMLAVDPRLDADGVAFGLQGVAQDITERKEIAASLIFDATRDRVTGLPNRYLLLDRLGQAVRRANLHGVQVAVLLADLDCAASVESDAILLAAADRLVTAAAPTDTVARFERNQLVVLCEEIDGLDEARARAECLLALLRGPYAPSGSETFIDASIGIATSEADATPESIIRDAEVAMARARQSGGNCCEVSGLSPRRAAE